MSLIELREKYKKELEVALRDNQMKGVTFIIDKCMNELFDELIRDNNKGGWDGQRNEKG